MTSIIPIQRATSATGDVIFVHGLGGDALDTWNFRQENSWKKWISLNRPDLNIWSVAYRVEATEWTGGAMPLSDRALNLLAMLDNKGIGQRPIVFIGHSMGGLLIKEMMRHALTVTERFRYVAEKTKAVVFFATPHTGSALADLARYFNFVLRNSVAIDELVGQQDRLRHLNLWYRNNYAALGLRSCIFFETGETMGVRVVNETSADPGIPQVSPIGIDANHVSITKPLHYADLVIGQTLKTIDEAIPNPNYRYDPDRDMGEIPGAIDPQSSPVDPHKSQRSYGLAAAGLVGLVATGALAWLVWHWMQPSTPTVAVDSEMYVGHWSGFPQIAMRFKIDNPTSASVQFTFNNGKLIAPGSGKQIVLYLDGFPTCNGSVPTTPFIQVDARRTQICAYSFLPYVDFGPLTSKLDQMLAQKGGVTIGPRAGLIEEPLLTELKEFAKRNFQWRVGTWEIRLDYSLGTTNTTQRTTFDIKEGDIERMKAVMDDYDGGYGVYAVWRNWTPDRSQPMPQVEAKPVVTQ